jgi:hypothetical protein
VDIDRQLNDDELLSCAIEMVNDELIKAGLVLRLGPDLFKFSDDCDDDKISAALAHLPGKCDDERLRAMLERLCG